MSSSAFTRLGTIAIALLLLGGSLAIIHIASGFPASRMAGSPGPGQLPILFAAILGLVSVGIIATAWHEAPLSMPGARELLRVVVVVALVALFVGAMPHVPFLLLAIPWVFATALFLGTGWRGALITAIVMPGIVHLAFKTLLGVPLT